MSLVFAIVIKLVIGTIAIAGAVADAYDIIKKGH